MVPKGWMNNKLSLHDETEKVVDFRKRRVTDTGLNKRITLLTPEPKRRSRAW